MTHIAHITWQAEGDFSANAYSRAHEWRFDGGAVIAASASPDIVPVPYSKPENVDPEEAFVAAISSCHMLWFLDYARRAGFRPHIYGDRAVGHMKRRDDGQMWIATVDLNIGIDWAGDAPSALEEEALHHKAHTSCFIANSVKSEIKINLTSLSDLTVEL